ncbi:sulfate transporter family-domain-containing protein [Elsinoe ampelina]|uniref:Sulfate transporter family-domain-containing protein n=1 Tax=Elsinoe ampelina TaxID=302913 RepID=A0A6A6G7V0_9PEZI|nr:sulfate transporter family-domain-containing protein [Elsinoe ampelina]
MADTKTKVGHGLAKVLGIKLNYRDELGHEGLTRGESVFSVDSADSYVEREPTVGEWVHSITPSGSDVFHYFKSLLPFLHWIGFYNLQWLAGDLVAGITVGAVVVPQSMAYAGLAQLPPEYGLYSSFMGVLIYWFFATSKDITIGPVAVMSTIVGNVVIAAGNADAYYKNNPQVIANALAIIVGAVVCFMGLARIGWLVNLISLTAISAFMTGSAINIAVGQVPTMMGITGFSTRDATYKVLIHTLQGLPRTTLDAAMGLTALFLLYFIRWIFTFLAKKIPTQRKTFFFCSTLRTAFVILLYTLISYLANRNLPGHNAKKAKFKILGDVPRGFRHAGVPPVNSNIISVFASNIPVSIIVLLIEHIAISKSFGRVNGYTIDPSQELVAIGVTNLLGPFLGAYPATGSFSRTAIKSKAGVRTPLAGVITAIVVLLAIYALPAVFFYIPSASLAAVIIHAVGDLITPPNTVYQFWRVSPFDVVIFFAGVIVTVFTSIEIGIYVTVGISAAVLLFRVFKARGRFMGKVQIHSVIGDHVLEEQKHRGGSKPETQIRNIFLPIDHGDGTNPSIAVKQPYPGVFIYRFSEGFNYPNADHYLEEVVQYVFQHTRRTNPNSYGRLGDRPWNNPGKSRKQTGEIADEDRGKPTLKAIILDFSSVNNVDITSIQQLIDVRNQLDRYASPDTVHWHFANINNRWTKRALAAAGFGYPTPPTDTDTTRWKPIFSVAELGGSSSAAADAEYDYNKRRNNDIEAVRSRSDSEPRNSVDKAIGTSQAYSSSAQRITVVGGINRPLFHVDLTAALQSAIANVEHRALESDSDSDLNKAVN